MRQLPHWITRARGSYRIIGETGKEPYDICDRPPSDNDPECTKILVLTEDGIAESGSHEELLARGGVYEKLYHMHY